MGHLAAPTPPVRGDLMNNANTKRILIVRLSAIGDVVMATPLIRAIRDTWPEARVSWIVEEGSRPVLEANPHLDEVIVWEREKWRRLLGRKRILSLLKEIFSFSRHLRARKYDTAIDAQGLLKSGVIAYMSGAAERIGLGSKEGSAIFMTRVVDRAAASDSMSSQYLLLAEKMGLNTGNFSMDMALGPEAEQFGDDFASSLSSPYAVFSPFTTRPQKHWIEERWRELAVRVREELHLTAVLLGGPGDAGPAERIVKGNHSGMVNMVGKTTIQQAAAIIRQASVLAGVDTGLTHIGYAMGVPSVALFGATRPYLDIGKMPGAVLYHPLECSPCRRNPTCDGDYTCMKAITTDEVITAMRKSIKAD